MEALLILGLLLALALLSPRLGRDSGEYPASAEEALARRGVAWERSAGS
jgi:hypothetical protein